MFNELIVRQGTVYRDIDSGNEYLIINHNLMGMESLIFDFFNEEAVINSMRIIKLEQLISMRKSPNCQEIGDIAKDKYKNILKKLLDSKTLDDELRPYIEGLNAE